MQSPYTVLTIYFHPKRKRTTGCISSETGGTAVTNCRNVIFMLSSIHWSIGVFLRFNFWCFTVILHCIILTVFMHVCCVIFNKVSISVSVFTQTSYRAGRPAPKRRLMHFWDKRVLLMGAIILVHVHAYRITVMKWRIIRHWKRQLNIVPAKVRTHTLNLTLQ